MTGFTWNFRNKFEYSNKSSCNLAIDTFSNLKWCVSNTDLVILENEGFSRLVNIVDIRDPKTSSKEFLPLSLAEWTDCGRRS